MMAKSNTKSKKQQLQAATDRAILIDLIWLGEELRPEAWDSKDDYFFYKCSYQPASKNRKDQKDHESENFYPPPIGFRLDIGNPRWEVDAYRVHIGYVEGHNHDLKNIKSACDWYASETITAATHAVDVDSPWQVRKICSAATSKFLPPKANNPEGKITMMLIICRDGMEKDNAKANKRPQSTSRFFDFSSNPSYLKRKEDSFDRPLATFIYKISFQEIKEEPAPKDLLQLKAGDNAGAVLDPVPGSVAPGIGKDLRDRAEIHGEDTEKQLSSLGSNTVGQPTPVQIDEDIQRMTPHEKDREIMRLRELVAAMQYPKESDIGNLKFSKGILDIGL
ncbi:hypothetical protein TWF718_006442 [Orbilia javanica]|uniref:Uncharacterized protein n=1 Tax=Orbilia javanica TaxID=47235 RepID=A0AAN8RJY0_9PEZI